MSLFTDKTLMITGGTGSFGNAVLNRFLQTDIGEIRIFSRDEKKQDDMRHEFQAKMPEASEKMNSFLLKLLKLIFWGQNMFLILRLKRGLNRSSAFLLTKRPIRLTLWEFLKRWKKELLWQRAVHLKRPKSAVRVMAMLCAVVVLLFLFVLTRLEIVTQLR